ncbi:MerR family transcriptional regulator [Paenibacillus sp. GSMTC-2017]|uniref:MerR family transcriptional regulator n=1 Tax=Paenibacillus sp. GSMTC-2017 TaxID=2794350 RepID=UPI0018D7D2FC|nr:MerR family transcriptional regulator [Paenibacillus sp. GSMTC-2017]MBH5318888.1 MerR family transcriptional regulator [Paenibacillus sp. GSMTC-2017]
MTKPVIYSIGQFSKLTGISIRTLHYYDEIGLLKANKDTKSGHRQYAHTDLVTLQKIVTFKFLGYSLEQIVTLVKQQQFDADLQETLLAQKSELEAKKAHIDTTLKAIQRAIALLDETKVIDSEVLISIIRSIQTEKEQREWLGKYVESKTIKGLFDRSDEEMEELDKQYVKLIQEVRRLVGRPVEDPEVQQMVDEQIKLNLGYVGEDTFEALAGLAEIDEDKIKELEALAPSPFTPDEDVWIQQVMEHYMKDKGLF